MKSGTPFLWVTKCFAEITKKYNFKGDQNVIFCKREETDFVTNNYLSFDDIFGKEINGGQESFKPGIGNN